MDKQLKAPLWREVLFFKSICLGHERKLTSQSDKGGSSSFSSELNRILKLYSKGLNISKKVCKKMSKSKNWTF